MNSATPDSLQQLVCESRTKQMDGHQSLSVCSAHETMKGWQKRDVKAKIVAQSRAKQLKLFLIGTAL